MKLDLRTLLFHSVLRRRIAKGGRIETVAEYIRVKQQHPDPYEPPTDKVSSGIDISTQYVGATLVYRLTPQQNPAPRSFVYVHGGSFISEIGSGQWRLVMELVRRSGSTCLVPIYALAPQATAVTTVASACDVIRNAVEEFGAANVSVLGDSAGGTIAVAAAQNLRDAGDVLPARLILLAPWLDLAMTHPDQATIAPHDLMMRRDYLLAAAQVYAGDLPLENPRVSPLFGDFSGLPPMHVFTGSHDVVATDSRQLVERVRAAGGEITYVEAPGMQHVYPIFRLIPEATKARKAIAKLLA
ncbi:acetyl esterase/lipase [Aeromicrobium panaciterrae]|uniref:Acetyl esterase/lipase n=1 Tax=Aeromicrobium panaciterrae TaxID=363861 RepID=A0ABU1UME1_9ACTN|nr:alpha/beta hydrolase [Aeromicrobium panaciterrae]MDR7086314.1 acetyl esterase/lipase [Aeromicrobium panaciterrae]